MGLAERHEVQVALRTALTRNGYTRRTFTNELGNDCYSEIWRKGLGYTPPITLQWAEILAFVSIPVESGAWLGREETFSIVKLMGYSIISSSSPSRFFCVDQGKDLVGITFSEYQLIIRCRLPAID